MKVAIVQDYLTQYGGAEKTLEALLEMYPEADIFTGIYNADNMSPIINQHRIIYPKNSWLEKYPKYLTFLMPLVFEDFDLSSYDLIISSGTAWAKSVITIPEQLHIAYIHTPPRFLYGYSVESQIRDKWYFKPLVSVIDAGLRVWDYVAAQRPDFIIANSMEVQTRIKKFYKRDSVVINPPVEINYKYKPTEIMKKVDKKYYLALGRLAAYKNFDLLIRTFRDTQLNLVIAGTGPEEEKLKKLSGDNVILLGKVTEDEKHDLLENCRALLFPVQDEDFGIVPVEAMSHGKPILAHRSGGVLETVREKIDGMFFELMDPLHLQKKLLELDTNIDNGIYNSAEIKAHTNQYSKEIFKEKIGKFVETVKNA